MSRVRFPSQLASSLVTATWCRRPQLRSRRRWKLRSEVHNKRKESSCDCSKCIVCVVCSYRSKLEATETQGHLNTTHSNTHHLCHSTTRTDTHQFCTYAHGRQKVPSKCGRGERSRNGDALRPQNHRLRRRTRRARSASVPAPAIVAALAQPHPIGSGRGRPCRSQQQLPWPWMDRIVIDWHPCASKQARIVRFALREQGSGGGRRRCKNSSW